MNPIRPPWYPFGTLCTRLLCATCCIPMGQGLGLCSGAHHGTVQFTLARSRPHLKVVHQHSMGTAHFTRVLERTLRLGSRAYILPYSDKRKQLLKMTFLENEQNVSVMYIDINAISLCLDSNILQQDECFCSKLGLEVKHAMSNLNTSISEIWVICHLLLLSE